MPNPPCLIIGYARPNNIEKLIQSAILSKSKKVYISIDGPKSKEIQNMQNEIVLRVNKMKIMYPEVEIALRFNTINLGIAENVVKSIDWFFDNETLGIILEDDLEVSKGFFSYMRSALEFLEFQDEILLASGTRVFEPTDLNNGYQYSNYPMIWGWGTLDFKWKIMRNLIMNETTEIKRGYTSASVRNYWRIGARRVRRGLIDTWDIPLAASMRALNYFCLIPNCNFVSNLGFDEFGSHTREDSFPLGLPLSFEEIQPAEFPIINQFECELWNQRMEKEVFKIRKKHYFLPLFSIISDWFFLPKIYQPLRERIGN